MQISVEMKNELFFQDTKTKTSFLVKGLTNTKNEVLVFIPTSSSFHSPQKSASIHQAEKLVNWR